MIDFELEKKTKPRETTMTIPARSTIIVKEEIPNNSNVFKQSYVVKNLMIAPDKGLPIELDVSVVLAK